MNNGDYLINELQKRKAMLAELVKRKNTELKAAPAGRLRISSCKTYPQYYYRRTSDARGGSYIPEKEIKLVKALAQKDYNERIIESAILEQTTIENYINYLSDSAVEKTYGKMSEARQNLIIPINESDEDFIKRWLSQSYPYAPDRSEHPVVYGAQGEEADSKSELLIAGEFNRYTVPYLPQFPLHLKGHGLVYADFKVLNPRTRKEYIWEHLGMLDKTNYRQRNLPKLNAYIINGYIPGKNLILTWESEECKFDLRVVNRLIRDLLL